MKYLKFGQKADAYQRKTRLKRLLAITPAYASAAKRVDSWMRVKYGIGLDAMDITATPGYWQDKQPQVHPGHPLHSCLGCSGPFRATYTYFDPVREHGRFASPTRSWRIIRDFEFGPKLEAATER